MTLLESSSISNCQKAFVHQTKTDNKQLGGTCNLTKNFPYPIPPIIVHNPDDEINEINKLAMIHQEQGDINAGCTKPPSTNITMIDNPDHNCQANTASNPVIYKQKVDSQCELKSYPNSNASNSKANEFKKKNPSDVNELKQTTLDNKIEHEQSLAKLRETNQNETPNDDILINENPRDCYTSEERNLDSVQYVSQRCYYVNGKIGHVRLNFLIDTGSSISVISEKTFGKICQDTTVLYDTDLKVHTANGSLLKLKGACTLQMQLDHIIFSQEFIVANIAEPGILGMSFLDQVEADIKIKKKTLKTNKGKIKLHKQGQEVCCRIKMCENVTIPPQSESYVKAYTPNICSTHLNIVEPTNKHIQRGLFVGKTLVDTSQSQMTISVLNVSTKSVRLKENTSLGTIQPIEMVSICDNKAEEVKIYSEQVELPDHLKTLLENTSPDLTKIEKQKLSDLLLEFQDVFMTPGGKLQQTHLAEHFIDTGDTKPFKMPCRRIPMFKKPIVEAEIKKMLDQEVIEPSNSEWNSPICLVAKKSGEWRFCVDLRQLNSVTKLDTFPLPNISETLDRLSNSRYFSTLDMVSGYWQISLNPHDQCKTSFAIPGIGTYMFKVMCFGLKNAPGSFSRLMEAVLRHLQFDKCLVYLDDIIVLGENFDTALQNLRLVFLRLRQASLQLKPSKCKLFQKEVVFLGHKVSGNGITCDPEKIKCIQEWPRPQDKKEVRSFLGLVGYYRKMVPAFSEVAIPLTKLTKKNTDYHWDQNRKRHFSI